MPSYNWMHNDPKRYISHSYSADPTYPVNTSGQNESCALFSIPLPNEREASVEVADLPVENTSDPGETAEDTKDTDSGVRAVKPKGSTKRGITPISYFFQYIQKHITLEDIILVALIIILLNEAIDDDILLVILIYILLF
jgi:hypothetical protein